MSIVFSVDLSDVYRKHNDADMSVISVVPKVETDPLYVEMMAWRTDGNQLIQLMSQTSVGDLETYKTQALNGLIELGNKFVKSLTADLLECEIQTFAILVKQARAYLDGETGAAVRQISTQALITNKTMEQVAMRTLELDFQMDAVVPVLSGLRQNVSRMISACTTHEQVDIVVETTKTQGRQMVADMMSQLNGSSG